MPKTKSNVTHPSHYGGDTTYEAIKVIEAWRLDFNLGNAAKYICRAGVKNKKTELEDLEKAQFYLKRAIDTLKKGGAIIRPNLRAAKLGRKKGGHNKKPVHKLEETKS